MVFITKQRKRMNLTQGQLAEKLGVTQGAVSQWENGVSSPDVKLLIKLSEVLGCTVDELLGTAETNG